MLKVNNLSIGYNDKLILEDISFSLKSGEIICIMGESGTGKSTLLKALYGLLDLKEGTIFWNEKQITGPLENLVPGVEEFKYVPQDFKLSPYTTVEENIAKFLPRANINESGRRVKDLLEIIEMSEFSKTKTVNLSGGQKQRVAIARALAKEPKLLLLDEPFGQIDNFKKNSLRRNLFTSLREENIPCIIATHDGEDALSFADKLIVFKDGKIIVNENPKKLYQNPKDKYTASLLSDVSEFPIGNGKILLYPNQLKIVEDSRLTARVIHSYFKGFYWLIECQYERKSLFIHHHEEIKENEKINFSIAK